MEKLTVGEIVVLGTDTYTKENCPERIGTEARIEGLPESSSTDGFLLVFKTDEQAMRIPRNCFRLPAKETAELSSEKASVYHSPVSVMDVESLKAPTEEVMEGQIAPVNAMSLRVGAPVRLLDNDSTRNRVPHLVNTIGYIREVPGKPILSNTFFHLTYPSKLVFSPPSNMVQG